MILLSRIELSNFLSHEKTELKFASSERILIDGKSGAGKSAIIDALVWGLYNVGRVQNRSLIKRGQTEAFVTVELDHVTPEEVIKYQITRKINTKGKHDLAVLVFDHATNTFIPVPVAGTKNLQAFIEQQILKCSYTLFINSVCYPQENPDNFVRQTPSKRKDLLLELVGAQNYEEYTLKVRDAVSKLESQLASWEGKQEQLEAELNRTEILAKPLPELEKSLANLTSERREIETSLTKVQEQQTKALLLVEKINSLKQGKNNLLQQISEIDGKLDSLSKRIKELRSLDAEEIRQKTQRKEQVADLIRVEEKKVQDFYSWKDIQTNLYLSQPPTATFDARLQELVRQQKGLAARKVAPERCPHCDKEHVCRLLAEEIQNQASALDAQILIVKEEKRAHEERVAEHQAKLAAHEAIKPQVHTETLLYLRAEFNDLQKYAEDEVKLKLREETMGRLLEEVTTLNTSKKTLQEASNKLLESETALEQELGGVPDLTAEKTRLLQSAEQIQTKVWEVQEALGVAKNAQSRIPLIVASIVQNQESDQKAKKELNGMKLLRDAFGANGIKAIVIDYLLPYLEQRINEVLQPLSDFRIRFSTQKANVAGDSVVEGLFITVINAQGDEMDFDSYSGGQKVKILFAITEGLAQMQKIGFRILDEAVVGLDEESGDQFAEAILAFKERFSQLICISHIQQIKDLFESKIQVTSLFGTSTVDK